MNERAAGHDSFAAFLSAGEDSGGVVSSVWVGAGWELSLAGRRRYADRDLADQELFEQGTDCTGGGAEERVADSELDSIPIGRWVVDVRDSCRGEIAEDVGIVGLQMAVVALADDDACDGIEGARGNASRAFVEIARILMKDGGEDCAANEHAVEAVGVGGTETFCEALRTLAVAGEFILTLLESCDDCSACEGDWVERHSEGEPVFLAGGERDRILVVADVEVGDHAQNALFLFGMQLLFGDLLLREDGVDLRACHCYLKRDRREFVDLSGVQDEAVFDAGGEACGADGELDGAGFDAGEAEGAFGVRG